MKMKLAFLALLSIWLALPATAQTTTGSYTITIAPAPMTLTPPSGALAGGTVNVPYAATVTIGGGIAPYTAAVSSGMLPTGVTIAVSGTSLNFSGTPTAPGTSSFIITVASSGSTAKVEMKVKMEVAERETPLLQHAPLPMLPIRDIVQPMISVLILDEAGMHLAFLPNDQTWQERLTTANTFRVQ